MGPVRVRVVGMDLDQPDAAAGRLSGETLSPEERSGGPRVRVAREIARAVLGEMLGVAPGAVPIVRECEHCGDPRHGRPRVAGGGVAFSLSHSGPVGILAVAPDGDVRLGVDVEVVRPRPHLGRLAERVLDPGTLARFVAAPETERLGTFLRAWTAKEAYLKATGVGIATALRAVPAAPAGWTVRALDAPPGAVAALAVDRAEVKIEYVTWAARFSASGGTAR